MPPLFVMLRGKLMLNTGKALAVSLVFLAAPAALYGQSVEPRRAEPGDVVRLWVTGDYPAVTGRLLALEGGQVRVDDGALHCGAEGCGPFAIPETAVTHAEMRARPSAFRQLTTAALTTMALGLPLLSSRACAQWQHGGKVACQAAMASGALAAGGGAFLTFRTHWLPARLY